MGVHRPHVLGEELGGVGKELLHLADRYGVRLSLLDGDDLSKTRASYDWTSDLGLVPAA